MAVDVMPDGAFYAWADVAALCERLGLANSWDFCLSTASSLPHLAQAMQRLQQWLSHG